MPNGDLALSLRHLILAVIMKEPSSGYQVAQEFDLVAGFFWKATHQQIYRELATLTQAGLVEFTAVEQTGKPNKKIYSITPDGFEAFGKWFAEPTPPPRVHDPLMIKFFAGSDHIEQLSQQLEFAIKEHEMLLEKLEGVEREFYAEPADQMPVWKLCIYLSLTLGIEREKTWLAWAERSMQTLRSL